MIRSLAVPHPSAPAPAATPRFAALHHRDFRRYLVFGLMSATADNIEHVISYWVIFRAFHSAALGGFAVISHWVPFLLFSVYSGALADRYDCRKLIQVSQGLFMLASLSWGLLFLTGWLRMWHAVVILTIHGLAGVVGTTAIQVIIHDMVGPEHLQSAVRLNASSRNLAILLGPAVGGGLMLLFGPAWGLLVNVLVYLPLTTLLVFIPYTGHTRHAESLPQTARPGFGESMRLLREVRLDRRLVTMIALAGATSFFVGNAFHAQMPGYAHDLGADDAGVRYSILLGANAAGAILGAVLLEMMSLLRPNARTAIICALFWSVTIGLFPFATSYPVAVILLALAGLFNIAFTAMAQTLVQLLAPPRLRGRIVGLFNTTFLGLRAGSGVTVGVLGAFIGIHRSLALSSAAVVVISAALLMRELRSLDAERPGSRTELG
jgi:MFS family permease